MIFADGNYVSHRVITATGAITVDDNILIINNGATAITLTLPAPATCVGKTFTIVRYAGSTGGITINGTRIQALNGTLGASTTVTALGNNENWGITIISVQVGATASYIRI